MEAVVAPILLGLLGLAYAQSQATSGPANDLTKSKDKPNFIFIITDDQDLRLGSLEYQSAVQKHFVDQGTTFSKHYCTISLCCPSRVSLLTGRAAHNTNVTDVSLPYGKMRPSKTPSTRSPWLKPCGIGGYPKFASEGWNDKYLPVWLQEAGYNTYYTGKLMNGFSTSTYNNPFPKGWTGTDFFLDPNTYVYYNVTMQNNKETPRTLTGQYSTDLVANKTLAFLDEALADGDAPQKPFFIGVAPIGPHSETWQGRFSTPVPADRHKELFPGLKVPRTPNFNPEVRRGLDQNAGAPGPDRGRLPRRLLPAAHPVAAGRGRPGRRHRAPAGCRAPAVLANTYLLYTSDNGFHVGQHRLAPGKACAIEEDINVPFVIRGPGIAAGQRWERPTSHTDIVPTLFELAGIPLQEGFDGVPMPVTEAAQRQSEGSAVTRKSEHVNVEFWGDGLLEGDYPGISGLNDTYKALRLLGDGYDLSYTVWCTNEHELYDLKADPWQMNNIYAANSSSSSSSNRTDALLYGWAKDKLIARVDALLLTLKACKGAVCRQPWEALHPEGNVHSLRDAMGPEFDDFYTQQQPRVSFSACKLGYLAEFEGAMQPSVFGDAAGGMAARWEDWT
ncbi:arylsulfatase [Apiospora phragmitis]|uniref:Arylsulfatase n=1 Tax=Apiospora phragmitis TaxID=2905665 RepID=A0ABR1WVR9_9PEZI